MEIYKMLKCMEDVGVFVVEVECIVEEVFEVVNDKILIVIFLLGLGMVGDVIMFFVVDVCGEVSEEDMFFKYVYVFGNVGCLYK